MRNRSTIIAALFIMTTGYALIVVTANLSHDVGEDAESAANDGQRYEIHSLLRPQPPRVEPLENTFTPPPRDAIVLFKDDLSEWDNSDWSLEEKNVMTCVGGGDIRTKLTFGDCQLHIEFRIPSNAQGDGQNMGNSGVFLMDNYEVQILNSYNNSTYADGTCGAIYGQYPPLLNASKPSNEWQSYDIYFTRPRFKTDGEFESPPKITVIHNGIEIHVDRNINGPTKWRSATKATLHNDRLPLRLQDHGNPVSYRNIWIRDLE
jgi:hypothetical protein